MGAMTSEAERAGQQAERSTWMDRAVRIGLVAYGLVHVMIAWLALQLALGDRSGEASSSGAVQELAQQPMGEVLVWVVAIGMFFLVAWRGLEATFGHNGCEGGERLRKRLVSAGKAVIYAVVGWSALTVAAGSSGSGGGKGGSGKGSGGSTDSLTAKIMDLPAGQLIVGAIGLGVVAYGAHHLYRAWTEKYAKDLSAEGRSGEAGTAYLWFGKVGYAAKGLAIGIVGGLFVYAAITHEAKQSGGLDEALRKVLEQPFGPFLLGAMALGIACYGLFNFARARHLSR